MMLKVPDRIQQRHRLQPFRHGFNGVSEPESDDSGGLMKECHQLRLLRRLGIGRNECPHSDAAQDTKSAAGEHQEDAAAKGNVENHSEQDRREKQPADTAA